MSNYSEYIILSAVGEEKPQENSAFLKLENLVNEHIRQDWKPQGGISVSLIVGPKSYGSTRDNFFLRVSQAMIKDTP